MNIKVKVNFPMANTIKWMPLQIHLSDIFFNNDIVEVLNLSGYQLGGLQNYNITGYRYKCELDTSYRHNKRFNYDDKNWKQQYTDPANLKISLSYQLEGINELFGSFASSCSFYPSQLRLYKRPFKNWLKYLWLLLTGFYYE